MVHSATKHTPIEARKDKNAFNVRLNLLLHKRHDRLYPPLGVGDKVKLYKKKKTFDKETKSVWSANEYEVENIEDSLGQNVFFFWAPRRDGPSRFKSEGLVDLLAESRQPIT